MFIYKFTFYSFLNNKDHYMYCDIFFVDQKHIAKGIHCEGKIGKDTFKKRFGVIDLPGLMFSNQSFRNWLCRQANDFLCDLYMTYLPPPYSHLLSYHSVKTAPAESDLLFQFQVTTRLIRGYGDSGNCSDVSLMLQNPFMPTEQFVWCCNTKQHIIEIFWPQQSIDVVYFLSSFIRSIHF